MPPSCAEGEEKSKASAQAFQSFPSSYREAIRRVPGEEVLSVRPDRKKSERLDYSTESFGKSG